MEQQLAHLTAQMAALKSSSGVTNASLVELYYCVTIPLMITIHAGCLAYEMGVQIESCGARFA